MEINRNGDYQVLTPTLLAIASAMTLPAVTYLDAAPGSTKPMPRLESTLQVHPTASDRIPRRLRSAAAQIYQMLIRPYLKVCALAQNYTIRDVLATIGFIAVVFRAIITSFTILCFGRAPPNRWKQ